jgi:hypothetical protein
VEKSRLHRLLKKSSRKRFVTGHDFSRADKPFIFSPESASADDSPAATEEAAEQVEKQIPRRPEGLLVMTKTK